MASGKSNFENVSTVINVTDISLFCESIIRENNFLKYPNNEINQRNISDLVIHDVLDEKSPNIVITIPAFNEEKTIGNVIDKIHKVMKNSKFGYNYMILVVNDGSSDETINVAENAGAHVFSHDENKGLAETFRTEMKICLQLGAEIIVHTDADGQYKAEEILILLEELENGYDLILGSRFLGTIEDMTFMKKLGNRAFSVVLSILTRKKISDGQTGFRAFTKEVAEKIPIISTHTYTQEQIIRATRREYNIKEVPVYFAKRDDGKSRLMKNPFDYAFRAWKNIFKIYFCKSNSNERKK